MIQRIKDRIIESLGGYTEEQHSRTLDRLEWRMRDLEFKLATESTRNRLGVETLRVKAEVCPMYEHVLKEDLKAELVRQLAKGIKPHIKFDTRPSNTHGLIEYTAEITVVQGGDHE